MHRFFSPGPFIRFLDRLFWPLVIITFLTLSAGIYIGLLSSPADYQQGEFVRIMYVHVPAAWMALGVYCFMAGFGAASLIWKNPLSDIIAVSAAPIGLVFTAICLITGSIWGKPTWGAWWVWDARLTSMLILFFFYIGYIALYHSYDDPQIGGRLASILALIGVVNIPIIKFSVEWWNTLHQPASIMRKGGIAIDETMLLPLMLMFVAFIGLFSVLTILRIKTEVMQRKLERS